MCFHACKIFAQHDGLVTFWLLASFCASVFLKHLSLSDQPDESDTDVLRRARWYR